MKPSSFGNCTTLWRGFGDGEVHEAKTAYSWRFHQVLHAEKCQNNAASRLVPATFRGRTRSRHASVRKFRSSCGTSGRGSLANARAMTLKHCRLYAQNMLSAGKVLSGAHRPKPPGRVDPLVVFRQRGLQWPLTIHPALYQARRW